MSEGAQAVTTTAFVLAGAAAGVVQAMALRRQVRGRPRPAGVLLRLLVVGAVLTLGALGGHLLAVAGGWAGGFCASAIVLVGRWS